MADEEIKHTEVIARLRLARGRQLAAIETIDAELARIARELVECETDRDRAVNLAASEARRRRTPKRAAGLLATASIPATISLSLSLGPLGLLALVGVGLGTGVAYRLDAVDRRNEEIVQRAVEEITEKIRKLNARKEILTRHRAKVEEKLRMTRVLLDKLRGNHG